ncbi:MAG: hypothetical protein AAFR96_02935 [Planctomycetota bacterium]
MTPGRRTDRRCATARPIPAAACALLLLALMAGCSSRYAITDPATGDIGLARSYDRDGSAVNFKDRVTRERRTVDTPEITELGEHEYDALLDTLRAQANEDPDQ